MLYWIMRLGRTRFASEEGGPNEDRTDPPPANHMSNWLFNYYVTALRWGSAPPPGKCGVLVWGPLLGSEARPPQK